MMRLFVESVGILGPGLNGWAASQGVLSGAKPHVRSEAALPKLDWLPAAERRRTGAPVKYALTVGMDALSATALTAQDVPTIFAASSGDGEVLHDICATLASSERQVSPTRFHNSVHNAAAGYWSIAVGARVASTSLCAYDWTFVAGLLETAAQVLVDSEAALLIAYDIAYSMPLRAARTVHESFACALLLRRHASENSLHSLELEFSPRASVPTTLGDASLEALRRDNPSARALPLLAAMARRDHAQLQFDYLDDAAVSVTVAPMGRGR